MKYITKDLLNYRKNIILEEEKQNIYNKHLDNLTCRKMRYQIQGKEWTLQDEEEYKKAYSKCIELIKQKEEELIPKDVVIVSEEEYRKLLEEQRKKEEAKLAEETALQQGEVENVRENKDDKQVL